MISHFTASNNHFISSNILPAYSVCQAISLSVPVHLMNTSHLDIEMHADQNFGEYCPLVEYPIADHNVNHDVSSHLCSTTTVSAKNL